MKIKDNFIGVVGICSLLVSAIANASPDLVNTTPNPTITQTNLLFASVHPDDVPLTFGGMIQNNQGFTTQNKLVVIFEPFSQTNYTADVGASIFTNERIAYVTALRYNEDANAYNDLFSLWSNYTFLGRLYPELSLRYYLEKTDTPPPFIDDGEDFTDEYYIDGVKQVGFHLFGPQSITYYRTVYNDFLRLLNQTDCAAFLPSAIGNTQYQQHPDHFLVREAAIQAAQHLASTGTPLDSICQIYFGQDQPYYNGDIPGSIVTNTLFRTRLSNTDPQYEIGYSIDKYAKWAMLQNYKSQLDPGYAVSLLKRSNEAFYLWPKANYATVQPDPTCDDGRTYCTY